MKSYYSNLRSALLFSLSLFCFLSSYSQDPLANSHWYFGASNPTINGPGLEFDINSPNVDPMLLGNTAALNGSVMECCAYGNGVASVTNSRGDILFTSGGAVMFYNKGTSGPTSPLQTTDIFLFPHPNPNPFNPNPDQSLPLRFNYPVSQPVVFIEHPAEEDSFYAIVNGGENIVAPGGTFGITSTLLRFDSVNNTYFVDPNEFGVPLSDYKSQSLTSTLKYNSSGLVDGAWIVTNRIITTNRSLAIEFTVIAMNSNGTFSNPTVTVVPYNGQVDSGFNALDSDRAALKISAQGNRLSGSHRLGFQSYITAFNNVTGSVGSVLTYVADTGYFFNTGSISSEFSGDGQFLYTVSGEAWDVDSKLSIYDLTAANAGFLNPIFEFETPGIALGQIQRGIDNVLYITRYNFAGEIYRVNWDSQVPFQNAFTPISYNGRFTGYGLPQTSISFDGILSNCDCETIEPVIDIIDIHSETCTYTFQISVEDGACIESADFTLFVNGNNVQANQNGVFEHQFISSDSFVISGVIDNIMINGQDCLDKKVTNNIEIIPECEELGSCKELSCNDRYSYNLAQQLSNNFIRGNCYAEVTGVEMNDCYQAYVFWGDGVVELIGENQTLIHEYSSNQNVFQPEIMIRLSDGTLCYTLGLEEEVTCELASLRYIDSKFVIVPNPTANEFKIVLKNIENQKGILEIYSIDGIPLKEFNFNSLLNYDVSDLGEGLYIVKITLQDGNSYTDRLIIK
ncbi:hypothetical protein BBFL7_01993 [Flavobacteria bacterium BBFL7]|nr:hypothetical protein BBFL7_01993 [Flavobacteria bacterium BBFL7]